MKMNSVYFLGMLPIFPQLLFLTGMSETAQTLKLLGVFESLKDEETKKLGNNFKGI